MYTCVQTSHARFFLFLITNMFLKIFPYHFYTSIFTALIELAFSSFISAVKFLTWSANGILLIFLHFCSCDHFVLHICCFFVQFCYLLYDLFSCVFVVHFLFYKYYHIANIYIHLDFLFLIQC